MNQKMRRKKMNSRYYDEYYKLLEETLKMVKENYLLRCINHRLKQKLKNYEQKDNIIG